MIIRQPYMVRKVYRFGGSKGSLVISIPPWLAEMLKPYACVRVCTKMPATIVYRSTLYARGLRACYNRRNLVKPIMRGEKEASIVIPKKYVERFRIKPGSRVYVFILPPDVYVRVVASRPWVFDSAALPW